jgi:hypothetical protein
MTDRTEASIPTMPREEHRLPGDQDAFHHHDTRRIALVGVAEGLLPPALAPALSLTPPTLFPHCWGTCFLMGIARSRCSHLRVRDESRVQTPLLPAAHAWD